MGLPIATIGSIGTGVCSCHNSPQAQTGSVITGSGMVMANGIGVSKIGDTILANCGHSGMIVSGSGTVMADGIGVASLTSSFVGCFVGTLISGSSNVLVS